MYTNKQLSESVKNSKSYSEVLHRLGLSKTGASLKLIRTKIISLKLDVNHFEIVPKKLKKKKTWQQILVKNTNLTYRLESKQLRRALIESGIDYKCFKCNISNWNNTNLTLEVHHKDNNWQNNEKSNLEFLCPNCHSQTDNFYKKKTQRFCNCGNPVYRFQKHCDKCRPIEVSKKHSKVKKPSKEELIKDFKELKYFTKVAQKYNITDNAIRKWCKSYKITKNEIDRNI